MERIGVDCRFEANGRVRVRRIRMGETWHTVAQGRQWQDTSGRHVLVMLAGERIAELLLSAEDLTFDLTVLPADALRQAPLSGIDEKPMKRASAAQLRELLALEEIEGYEVARG